MTTRTYPIDCQSAYCGKSSCDGCRHKPALDEFQKWVKTNRAEVSDPVWSPCVYTTIKPTRETTQ